MKTKHNDDSRLTAIYKLQSTINAARQRNGIFFIIIFSTYVAEFEPQVNFPETNEGNGYRTRSTFVESDLEKVY